MATRDDVKRKVCEAIDRQSERIIGIGETIRRNPEMGFKEVKTARLVEETLKDLGLSPRAGLALTGVRAEARGTKEGPTLALLGELDEARAAVRAGLALNPSFTIRRFRDATSAWHDNPTSLAGRERAIEGMRLAGVTEG